MSLTRRAGSETSSRSDGIETPPSAWAWWFLGTECQDTRQQTAPEKQAKGAKESCMPLTDHSSDRTCRCTTHSASPPRSTILKR